MTTQQLPDPRLAANHLLDSLAPDDAAVLAPHLRQVALSRGQTLFMPGDDVRETYFPCRTTVLSLLVMLRDGSEVEAATIGREGALGGLVSTGHTPAFGHATAQTPGSALVASVDGIEEAKRRSPRVADLFARWADVMIAQLMQSIACNALHDVEQRCCRWLLSTHDRAGTDLIRMTQESLAQMLGVQRTTVTTVARQLQDDGLIEYRRGRIQVLDRDGLRLRSCECYEVVEDHFQHLLPNVPLPRTSDLSGRVARDDRPPPATLGAT
ncbi:helix-turn-helix domain-containing protein [Phenylobacterium sp. J426]|uniref:Crp/Fnr family transcriptional regulator n=1 Tax=Phenylobacterium sp. J426 TaxID=2898439 RepID=UPI0021517A9B|nr:helix-turn-helix domain-containing protein [Phenylobacterium sp. J426]MCR5876904.1 helix-turn-helix domain-containing protein [Phenylobacterium sp. J426]